MRKVLIGIGKHWMRGDAAASFRRMLRDGMPRPGLVIAGRTLATQARLYALYRAGRGPVAAFPSPRAPHVRGVAFDASRGSAMQRWLTVGGSVYERHAGERLRANSYGFTRTVVGEAWHFAYDKTKDLRRSAVLRVGSRGAAVKALQRKLKVKADGLYGPNTKAAVIAAQKRLRLTPDGIAGPKTQARLGL